jgi:D-sedoheptulose 7-phosphate isomerase
MDFVDNYLDSIRNCLDEINKIEVGKAVDAIFEAYRNQKRVYVIGNGGSAATATHFACDLSKGTSVEGKTRLAAISLTDNISILTAVANDIGYPSVFKEQLAILLNRDDVVIGISASGNSPNILEAIKYAKSRGAVTVGICGFGGGELSKIVDKPIVVQTKDYRSVEDAHMIIAHMISREIYFRISQM